MLYSHVLDAGVLLPQLNPKYDLQRSTGKENLATQPPDPKKYGVT